MQRRPSQPAPLALRTAVGLQPRSPKDSLACPPACPPRRRRRRRGLPDSRAARQASAPPLAPGPRAAGRGKPAGRGGLLGGGGGGARPAAAPAEVTPGRPAPAAARGLLRGPPPPRAPSAPRPPGPARTPGHARLGGRRLHARARASEPRWKMERGAPRRGRGALPFPLPESPLPPAARLLHASRSAALRDPPPSPPPPPPPHPIASSPPPPPPLPQPVQAVPPPRRFKMAPRAAPRLLQSNRGGRRPGGQAERRAGPQRPLPDGRIDGRAAGRARAHAPLSPRAGLRPLPPALPPASPPSGAHAQAPPCPRGGGGRRLPSSRGMGSCQCVLRLDTASPALAGNL